MSKRTLLASLFVCISTLIFAQQNLPGRPAHIAKPMRDKFVSNPLLMGDKRLTVDDITRWKRVTSKIISGDGKFVAVTIEPWSGASTMFLYDDKGNQRVILDSISAISFTEDSKFLIAKESRKKTDNIIVINTFNNNRKSIDSIKSYSIPEKWNGFIAAKRKDSTLLIYNLEKESAYKFSKSIDYKLPKERAGVVFSTKSGIYFQDLSINKIDTICATKGKYFGIAISESGDKIAFGLKSSIFLWQTKSGTKQIIDSTNMEIPNGWEISSNKDLLFSENANKLYFGTAPKERIKDTSIKKDDYPKVNIWHWQEKTQFNQQLLEKESNLKRTYQAVYDVEKAETHQIASLDVYETKLIDKGNSDLVLAYSDKKYKLEEMWTGRPKYDYYLVNTMLKRSTMILEGLDGFVRISPSSKFLYWYNNKDSSWYSYSIANGKQHKLTSSLSVVAYDELNDVPDLPASYSSAGWIENDNKLLVYDRYDIWSIDPQNSLPPVNLTKNGRERKVTYRVLSLSEDIKYIDSRKDIILSAFNESTKGYGYYKVNMTDSSFPQALIEGNFLLTDPIKAKKSDALIYSQETFDMFPDILLSNLNFKKSVKLTNANPQQADFNWGTAELIKWISSDGKELEGVIYKPKNFDPSKKYPMIVNFYERNSSTLHSYRIPEPHRSTIDYHLYTSNGYIVFNPDIVYREGYPGESAFNCVMSGISVILNKGYVDEKRIGAQGHSWGGYQVAYLATKTELFAAIESGAPVVNMFSAYGGVRWGEGINRSFQYEHQQSRIANTPWGAPQRYFENSPLFEMDKVKTPILILHNDNDGHVPWYQGIEFFFALKRLQKPVWMLNYTGEIHWPQKLSNKIDFQKRMLQFFNHYLKGDVMPKWMKEGLTAIDLDYELGY